VVRRNDFLVESQSCQVCVECGIRHDTDDDVGIFLFNGAAKAENLQREKMTKTGENLNFFLDGIKVGNVVPFLVAYEKNGVPHSGKLVG
jgi:hypothetical protein